MKQVKARKDDKEEVIEKKSKILAWIRLGIFSIFFYIFFIFAVLLLNIMPSNDTYQLAIDIFRIFVIFPVIDIYSFIVPPELWHNEATYITASLVLLFFTIGFLCSNKPFKKILFTGSVIKRLGTQTLFFFGPLIGFLRIFQLLPKYIFNLLTPIYVLIVAAIIWLIYQTIALFNYARRYSSSAESFLLKHDNKVTYTLTCTSTFWGIAILVFIGYFYLIFVGFTQFFGVNINLWQFLTLFLGGLLGFICIVAFFTSIFSKPNKRERMYDNLSILISNISLWPYILLNLAIYFIFSSELFNSDKVGSTIFSSNSSGFGGILSIQFLILVDLVIPIFILVFTLRGIGAKANWKFGILERDGFILTTYGAIMGQYGIKYLLFRQQMVPVNTGNPFSVNFLYQLFNIPSLPIIPQQNFWYFILSPNLPLNPYINTFIMYPGLEFLVNMGNIITSVAAVILLFGALVAYILYPDKFGIKYRIHEVGAKGVTVDFIYNFMKKEFNRRKQPFPIYEVQKLIADAIDLDIDKTLKLINKANLKYKDFKIDGNKKRYIYFKKTRFG